MGSAAPSSYTSANSILQPVLRGDHPARTITSVLGINDLSELSSPEMTEKMIHRYLAMETIENGSTSYSPASAALTLLSNGVGSQASENLFLSLLT